MKRLTILLLIGLAGALSASAQTTLTGKVTDRKGEPVPGARVSVWKGEESTLTELDGSFRLDTEERPKQLIVDYVGLSSQKVRTKADELNIRMFPAHRRCYYQGEVAVTYGFGEFLCEYTDLFDSYFDATAPVHLVAISTTHGIRFTRAIYLGLGIQAAYFDIPWRDSKDQYTTWGHAFSLPVYADLRFDIPFSKSVSMFLDGKAGVGVSLVRLKQPEVIKFQRSGSFYIKLSLGVQIHRFSIALGTGGTVFGTDSYYTDAGLGQFTVGYNF